MTPQLDHMSTQSCDDMNNNLIMWPVGITTDWRPALNHMTKSSDQSLHWVIGQLLWRFCGLTFYHVYFNCGEANCVSCSNLEDNTAVNEKPNWAQTYQFSRVLNKPQDYHVHGVSQWGRYGLAELVTRVSAVQGGLRTENPNPDSPWRKPSRSRTVPGSSPELHSPWFSSPRPWAVWQRRGTGK